MQESYGGEVLHDRSGGRSFEYLYSGAATGAHGKRIPHRHLDGRTKNSSAFFASDVHAGTHNNFTEIVPSDQFFRTEAFEKAERRRQGRRTEFAGWRFGIFFATALRREKPVVWSAGPAANYFSVNRWERETWTVGLPQVLLSLPVVARSPRGRFWWSAPF